MKKDCAEYRRYMESDKWKTIALETKRLANFRCQLCNKEGILHVHHRTYERFGHELQSDLICLCEDCHNFFHEGTRIKYVPNPINHEALLVLAELAGGIGGMTAHGWNEFLKKKGDVIYKDWDDEDKPYFCKTPPPH